MCVGMARSDEFRVHFATSDPTPEEVSQQVCSFWSVGLAAAPYAGFGASWVSLWRWN